MPCLTLPCPALLCRVCGRSVPYAFRHLPLQDLPPGYPVYLDINLSQEGAQTWLSWLQEGLLLDERTRGLVAHLITYNSDLKVFGAVKVSFDFQQEGSIKVRAQHTHAWWSRCSWCLSQVVSVWCEGRNEG